MGWPTTTGTVTVHVIGRCPVKTCTNRKRTTITGVIKTDRIRTWTELALPATDPLYTGTGVNPRAILNTRPSSTENQIHRYERDVTAAMRTAGWVCEEHDRFMTLNPVKGVIVADKTCNHRCTNAVGPDCECSCGGEKHGAAYA